jgi:hypothetical protein
MTVDSFFKAFKEAPGKFLSYPLQELMIPFETSAGRFSETRCKRHWQSYRLCLTISERLVENKTDNKYYYDDAKIPMDGQLFTLDTDIIKE